MLYQVLDNKVPCTELYDSSDWDCCVFDNFYDAQIYAYEWVYPPSIDIKQLIETDPFVLNIEKICVNDDDSYYMKIIEIKTQTQTSNINE